VSTLIEHQLRIRNATDTADAIVITSIRGGTNPYISKAPTGDGSSVDPLTMESIIGEYAGQIADWPIGSMQRVLTLAARGWQRPPATRISESILGAPRERRCV
jgi:hypothetical protein